MDPRFFRKFADLITEAEQATAADPQQVAQALQTKLKPEEKQAMIAMAEKIVGKPVDQITPQDAQRFGPAFEKALKGGGAVAESQLNELNLRAAWDTAKTKLVQLGFLGSMAAGTAFAMGHDGGAMAAGTIGGVLLMSLGALAGSIGDLKGEYQAHKDLQTATDPGQKQQLNRKIDAFNR